MGDGGVACVPSQHVMEKFSICGGKTNGKPKVKSSSKSSIKVAKVKKKMKQKKDKGNESGARSNTGLNKEVAEKSSIGEVHDDSNKEEVEEGELGTLPVENTEFVHEKLTRRHDIEKGEFFPGRWRKSGAESERNEWGSKDELEKGEFQPDRWARNEFGNRTDEYGYSKTRRYDSVKEKGWRGDREWTSPSSKERWRVDRDSEWNPSSVREKVWKTDRDSEWTPSSVREKSWKVDRDWSPPSREKGWKADRQRELTPPPSSAGKFSGEKEFSRSGGSHHSRKFSYKYEAEKTPKTSSNELSNGKNHARDHSFTNRSNRHGNDSDIDDRKHRDEYDYSSLKARKLSDDSAFSGDHYSGRFVERPYKNASRNFPSERFSSRHVESSRTANDRQNSGAIHSERSPRDRARNYATRGRSPVRRGKSPYDRSRSPYDRSRHYDNRYRSPSYAERSPLDQGRNRDLERSPFDKGRYSDHKETNRKGEKRPSYYGSKGKNAKHNQKDSSGTESQILSKEDNLNNDNGSIIKTDSSHEVLSQTPTLKGIESSHENGVSDEPASMEEDMDICNTPPHVPVVADAVSGKWYHLDLFGEERGPSKLSDLKTLVEEGYLVSDHLIKHVDSDRWVTVENAVSPSVVTRNLPSIFPDTVTQLVSPPQASGNLLEDIGKLASGNLGCEEVVAIPSDQILRSEDNSIASKHEERLHIDERVGALLEGVSLIPGKELEIVEEVLQKASEHEEWVKWQKANDVGDAAGISEFPPKDTEESIPITSEKDNTLPSTDTIGWFSGQWSCKGGDWKRIDESFQDRTWNRKLILNDGYPLCQMPKSGCEDPRWHQKDELYCPSQNTRLDLPPWAFISPDEFKPSSLVKGVKGTMLPVVRINACVVKDSSFVSESSRVKSRGKERYTSRSSRPYSSSGETKRSSEDSHSTKNASHEQQESHKSSASFMIPKDRLSRVDELQLHKGDWYYLDGAGHEQGPLTFSELQALAEQGVIQKQSSVFRKRDKVWVPVVNFTSESSGTVCSGSQRTLHNLHPQFIGYTRGKLHELVMKSYKSREFAAAINEVLDPWINAKQPKKEMEKHIYHSDEFRTFKRARIDEIEENVKDESSYDELCVDVTFTKGEADRMDSWSLLHGHILARVFHFLRADVKSFFYASLTCKHWKSVTNIYKEISRQVDFSAVAPNCTDSMVLNIMNDYKKEKISSLLLRGCTSISSGMLEELVRSFPCISSIDIRGSTQLEDLVYKFPNIHWVKSHVPQLKHRSINYLSDKNTSSTSYQMDDSSGLKEYLESLDKRDSTNQLFRRSLYKRSKLFDARKSSSILSRDAQLRRLTMKKSGSGYKRMEEFIAISLRDIMKDNTFEFFEPKVAEIEERMKNGYYSSRGLNAIKEDISRMCQDAIKIKNRADARDVNRIVTLFIRLVTRLDQGSNLPYGDKDEKMKSSWKDDSSPPGFSSKYKKNLNKYSEKKQTYRSNGRDVSDREIRRRLSKLNKKSLDSGSETSDDSDGIMTDSESAAASSDTESDLEIRSENSTRESSSCFPAEDLGFDSSFSDDREWGARMTKASLVPPVTRKYEVIDRYMIVADEEEVKRKMEVSLPEDYAEKIKFNGTEEESDMEIPEVKEFKPRKSLGEEVLEQEVYGIDPYTHNLLLDSMPEESEWSLLDKHLFIEDVLLLTLNKQVRNFTGSGNTPMIYPLKPVFEEILKTAEENHDRRTARLCQMILKAIGSRPEDNYVAYRKGLGVVCNKEGGFSQDDFVVEFLGEVYPTWKWYEKQDGIRSLQKNNKDPAPEFYNIYLERPKGDADGYDLVVVDAMHKANYASRICHSCRPNCEAKVTAVDGQYQIGIYSVRPIAYGEEITFDYNSVTESKEEYEVSVCLCGNQVCRGSYLNLTGEGAFQKVLKEHHGLLDRHRLLLEACELNSVSEEDYIDLGKAGLGSCLLGGLPDWLIAYSARLVRFINFERTKLPHEILKHNIEEKKKYFADISLDVEKSDAEIQAEGVYNQRLQNLALTIDKVKYVMRCVFGDPKNAPPPLERLSPEAAASYIWKGDGSVVEELIQAMAPHLEEDVLMELEEKIQEHDPCIYNDDDDVETELRKSLLWLRDEVRNLSCTYKSRHDAAADLIHIYAYTKSFFRVKEYKSFTSPPVYITPLDLGPKFADKLGADGVHEYRKTYGETYCLGQLMFWHNQDAEPDVFLSKASRGCLSLPDVSSFYAKVQKPSRQRIYGPRTLKFMIARMEKQPQTAWPKDRIWTFSNPLKFFGSPMLDGVLDEVPIDKEMVYWLKHRPSIFQAMWDK